MTTDPIQNFGDFSIDNPLPRTSLPTDKAPVPTTKPKLNFKDPKIMALAVLSVILILLLVASLVVTLSRKVTTSVYQPTAYPTQAPSPTPMTLNVPEEWKGKLNVVQSEIGTTVDFAPPEFDTQIGI